MSIAIASQIKYKIAFDNPIRDHAFAAMSKLLSNTSSSVIDRKRPLQRI